MRNTSRRWPSERGATDRTVSRHLVSVQRREAREGDPTTGRPRVDGAGSATVVDLGTRLPREAPDAERDPEWVAAAVSRVDALSRRLERSIGLLDDLIGQLGAIRGDAAAPPQEPEADRVIRTARPPGHPAPSRGGAVPSPPPRPSAHQRDETS